MFEAEYSDSTPAAISVRTTGVRSPTSYLRLIARLQTMATVPSLDMIAYARRLDTDQMS